VNFRERVAAWSARFTRRQKAAASLVALALAAAATVGGLAAASTDAPEAAPSSTPPPPAPSTTATRPKPTPTKPKPRPKPKRPVNPLTGVGRVPKGPVVAVKIDDTGNGRPQRGVDQADIVYVEQAEGGLTRLVAVFGTRKPLVEAVRSVRTSDPELLSQYGRITLVASGGGGDSLPTLDRSILHSVINDRGGPGFGRDGSRPVPYNLTSNLAAVSAATHGTSARSIGFTWVAKPKGLRSHGGAQVNTLVGSTPVNFSWKAAANRYVRYIGGVAQTAADGRLIATPNVIVQFCKVTVHPGDVDVTGNPAMYTHSIGHGKVAVFRNGRRIDGTWTRVSATSGTRLRDSRGQPIPLLPGGAWVILVANGAPLSS
jgi:Protein of unknown function (DUF3048) N-terminal domain/Protein of unknown function (DUF3048) C-terminal domain